MLLRALGAITAFVIGFAGVTSPALAQIYPPGPRYVPPPPPFRQLPPADLDDDLPPFDPPPGYRQPAPPPYAQPPRGNVRRICVTCFNSHPANLAASNRVEPSNLDQPIQEPGPGGIPSVPCPSCIDIPTAGPTAPAPETPREKRLHVTRIDPAMLVHRVEPVYPTLARQIGRSGRVELRAIIATDGTIQSLQVISGDPFFYQSALDAVRQWRYKPTVLNGEAVEIDTFISVIYNMDRGR